MIFFSGIGSLSHHVVSGTSSQALAGTVAELFIPFLQQEGEVSCFFSVFVKLLLSWAGSSYSLLLRTNPDFFMLCYKIHCTILKSSPVETTLCLLEARAFFSFLTPTLSAFCFMCSCVLCNCCTDVSPVLLPSPRRHVGSCGLCPGSLVCSVHHRSP